jgi:hypothetical protein
MAKYEIEALLDFKSASLMVKYESFFAFYSFFMDNYEIEAFLELKVASLMVKCEIWMYTLEGLLKIKIAY